MFRWTLHLSGGPTIEGRAAVTVGGKVYCFEAHNDDDINQIDVHIFNTVSLLWRKLPPAEMGRGHEVPFSFCGHSAVLVENAIYLWGGMCRLIGESSNALYAFGVDTHRWFKPRVYGSVPERRYYHSACVLGKDMFIHGGLSEYYGETNDVCKLDTTTMVWSSVKARGTLPPVSECHSAAVLGKRMFVFGGYKAGDETTGNLHHAIRVFDTETNYWMRPVKHHYVGENAQKCWFNSAFVYAGELYLFDYYNQRQTSNGPWKLNPETLSWAKVEAKGKGPAKMSETCAMVGDRRVVVFGNRQTAGELDILEVNPTLKTLCQLAVIRHGVEKAALTRDVRWEVAAMSAANVKQQKRKIVDESGLLWWI